jgi:hypothetical protein
MKKVMIAAMLMLTFGSGSFAQTIDSNDSKAKRKAKVAKHNTKQGWKNTRSDVKTGVKAARDNKQSR